MERLLADAEKLTGKKYDINNLSDVYEAIHAIQKQMGITGTTAKEAEHTFTGSLSAMKASASNLLGKLALGEDIKPSLEQLASTTSTFLFNNFLPMVGNILKGLPTVIGGLLQEVGPMFLEKGRELVNNLGQGMTGGMGAVIGNIVKAFSPLGEALQTVFGQIQQLIKTVISQISPIITTIGTALGKLNFDGIKNYIESIIPALQAGFQTFMSIVSPAIDSVVQSFVSMWNAAQPLIAILSGALMPVFQILGSYLGGVVKGVLSGVSFAFDALKVGIEFLTPVVDFLVQALNFVQPVLSTIAEWVGVAIGMFGNLGTAGQGLSAFTKSAWTNIQSAVQTAGNIIRTVIDWIKLAFSGAGNAAGVLKNVFSLAWMAIGDVVNVAKKLIGGAISGINSAFTSFQSFVSSVGGAVNSVVNSIISTIKGIANIDISGAGAAIMNGFLGGLQSAWGGVKSFVGDIAQWIKDHKGPISYDRKLLIPAGNAIMDGLSRGLKEQFKNVKSTVTGMADELQNAFGAPQLATDMPVNMSGQIAGQLSSQKLAYQVANTSQSELSNFDLYNMINKIANRQIVVSAQFNENEFARMVAEPVNRVQTQNQTALARMRGDNR